MTCRLSSARLLALALLGALAVPALAAAQTPGDFGECVPESQRPLGVESSLAAGAIIPCPPPALQVPVALPAEISSHPLLALKLRKGTVDGISKNREFGIYGLLFDALTRSIQSRWGWKREVIQADAAQAQFVAQAIDSINDVEDNGVSPAVPTAGLELPPPPPSLRPARVPVPALYRLGVTARQTLTGSLLLAIHPLLMLTPTADFLDAPADHPQPVAGDDILETIPPPDNASGYSGGVERQVIAYRSHIEVDGDTESPKPLTWYEWFVGRFIQRHMPSTPQPEIQLAQFLVDASTEPPKEPAVEQLHVMPKESKAAASDITCPYLRQQAADRHVRLMADPQVTQDVLGNLKRLVEADRLFEVAGELLRDGYVSEAMTCYDVIRRLVPGSRFEAQVAEALAEFGIGTAAEAAEEPQAEPQRKRDADSQDQEEEQPGVAEQVAGLMKACRLALEAGDIARAADLARQACALDPECVGADPLIYKLHLLNSDPPKCSPRSSSECPRRQEPAEEAEPPVTLRPELPPIDPGVVGALDGLLPECRVLPAKPGAEYPLCVEEQEARQAPAPDFGELMNALLGGHGQIEIGVGVSDGGLRLLCDFHCAGKVFHLVYRQGGLGLWTTHDAAAEEEDTEDPR